MISGSGSLVLVVGSSGAGKDSVLRFARARLGGDSRFSFPKRVITRLADTASEDHETIDDHGFEMLATGDVFALQWQAHDLKYGVRRTIEDDLAQGRIVSVNVSRTIVAETAKRYPAIVVEIFADPDVLAARIAAPLTGKISGVRGGKKALEFRNGAVVRLARLQGRSATVNSRLLASASTSV